MKISKWWVAISVSLSIQAYVLFYVFHYGALIGLLQWDDCAVILRGIQNLDRVMHAESGLALVQSVYNLDIHAPLSDLQTMIGLGISGGGIWGPYLLSAVWLALTLAALLYSLDRSHWLLATVVILLVVSQPLTLNALSKVKSDWSGGVLMAGALFLLGRATQTVRESEKRFGAALLGLALLSKLTAFYLPVVAAAALLLLEWQTSMLGIQPQTAEAPRSSGKEWARIARLGFLAMDRRALALRLALAGR